MDQCFAVAILLLVSGVSAWVVGEMLSMYEGDGHE